MLKPSFHLPFFHFSVPAKTCVYLIPPQKVFLEEMKGIGSGDLLTDVPIVL